MISRSCALLVRCRLAAKRMVYPSQLLRERRLFLYIEAIAVLLLMALLDRDPFLSGNSEPLAERHDDKRKQRKHPHHCSEYAKGHICASILNPVFQLFEKKLGFLVGRRTI